MTRIVHHPHGVIVDGKTYHHDHLVKTEYPSGKDWALFGLIMVALGALVIGLGWLVVSAIRNLL